MNSQGLVLKRHKNRKKINPDSFYHLVTKDIFGNKLNNKKKEVFYLELYSMLHAGMDIKDSMEVFIEQQNKSEEKKIFKNLVNDLVEGSSLSQSMQNSKQFTAYEFYCIQIGEESGRLMDVLKQLADFFSERVKMIRQIVKSVSYPIVILLASLIATGFMITFIVPMFSNIFQRFGSDLPLLTKIFINISGTLKNNLLIIALVITSISLLLIVFWNHDKIKKTRQLITIKIPYLGNMTTSIYMARFCSAMSLLISAKIPLVTSINLVKKMISFYPIQIALDQIEVELIDGNDFHKSLAQHKIFDAKMISLLKVGEEVNKLDEFFKKLHSYYSDEVDMRANALNTFLEPLIIIFLGLTVGAMLIAMYLPMFQLSNSIG
ncbi:type II secretion system F family protein [Draconibacterium sp. IB214405]|uniref:type II secretion system F family protein n=1 Tax=Draconibacterium sp. IB214405 TaxID=3097352 RepID=UPI002A16260D|nr:type II secretion system F family protein [Draconibacterium sp. IB214405]MDX8341689.1 type II secretion system F family protein [Draconibacterium sp. IB214405]